MHELQVTPLLMHKGSKSRHHQHRLKRGSQSFDECGAEDYHTRSSRHHKPSRVYKRQRSNPNILDLIPPPPPLYAPPLPPSPDYPQAYDDQRPGSSSKPQRTAAFKIHHIKDRRDSDTSEYFTQVSEKNLDMIMSICLTRTHSWLICGLFARKVLLNPTEFCLKCFLYNKVLL